MSNNYSFILVVVNTTEGLTTVEAVYDKNAKSNLTLCQQSDQFCPLCPKKLPNFKYLDVLILSQFLNKSWKPLPRHVTGLCVFGHNTLKMKLTHAQLAGLIPRPADHPDNSEEWNRYNIYFEE